VTRAARARGSNQVSCSLGADSIIPRREVAKLFDAIGKVGELVDFDIGRPRRQYRSQLFEIEDVTDHWFSVQSDELPFHGCGTRQPGDDMAVVDEQRNKPNPDDARRPGKEHAHASASPLCGCEPLRAGAFPKSLDT